MAKRCVMMAVCLLLAAPAAADEELIWQDGKWVKPVVAKEGTPEGEAALVRQDMDGQKYKDAVSHAERFVKRYPGHALGEEAMGLAGDAELRRGRYWQAYEWYEKQVATYPGGGNLERALRGQMEVAEAFLAGKKRIVGILRLPATDEGLDILQRIAGHAPGTLLAETALLRAGDYHFSRHDWREAVDAYDAYLKLFPKSERAAYAELRAAEAWRQAYRGPTYDDTPLLEAQQRYRAIAQRYPALAEEARVAEVLENIRVARAEKHYVTGRFYARTGKKAAAIEYFRVVAEQFPDTQWAIRAEIELTKLGCAPAPLERAGSAAATAPAAPPVATTWPTTRPAPTTRPTTLPVATGQEARP